MAPETAEGESGLEAVKRTVLVTGSGGFMGRNLVTALRRHASVAVLEYDLPTCPEALPALLERAQVVFHLAGVNRPPDPGQFTAGNVDLTRQLCAALERTGRPIPLALSSSIQAELDNPYGRSKREAELAVEGYHERTGAPVRIYRFPNVFGKWSRPHYNTVVATFCHQLSHGLPVQINNPEQVIRFLYIDDLVREFLGLATREVWPPSPVRAEVQPEFRLTLAELQALLASFAAGRETRVLPNLADPLVKYLYATFLSFCDPCDLARPVELKRDERGWLFELVKSAHAGQVFVSTTRPGVTRGNHYHDTKVEKFCVIQGRGVIRLRPVLGGNVLEYPVDDTAIRVVDIPPGYTHSIKNTGERDMVTLFWANEIFDPQRPDTHAEPVLKPLPEGTPQ